MWFNRTGIYIYIIPTFLLLLLESNLNETVRPAGTTNWLTVSVRKSHNRQIVRSLIFFTPEGVRLWQKYTNMTSLLVLFALAATIIHSQILEKLYHSPISNPTPTSLTPVWSLDFPLQLERKWDLFPTFTWTSPQSPRAMQLITSLGAIFSLAASENVKIHVNGKYM